MVCLCQVILYRQYLFDFAWRFETATPRKRVGRALLPLCYPTVFCATLMYCINAGIVTTATFKLTNLFIFIQNKNAFK